MTRSNTILVDMDSIISDFYFGTIDAYEKDTGVRLPDDCMAVWENRFPNGKGCYDYFSQPGFFRNLKPIPGAHDTLKAFHDEGHEIVVVSSATVTHGPGEKFEWLTEHYPWLDRKRVIFAAEKFRVKGDFLIDDHSLNTGKFLQHNPWATTIGIEYPYNVIAREAFHHLVPSYLDFQSAWQKVNQVVRMNLR